MDLVLSHRDVPQDNEKSHYPHETIVSFYESLILLHSIGPLPVPQSAKRCNIFAGNVTDGNVLWRNFLDSLCWLCDHKGGGTTVTSIAAEQTDQGCIFWVAANGRRDPLKLSHLKHVLNVCRRSRDQDAHHQDLLFAAVLELSVKISRKRVDFYTAKLRCATVKAGQLNLAEDADTATLIQRLRELLEPDGDRQSLCNGMLTMGTSDEMITLQNHVKSECHPVWKIVRHYVGRLCSWNRAVTSLRLFTNTSPEMLESFSVKAIPRTSPSVSTLETCGLRAGIRDNQASPSCKTGELRSVLMPKTKAWSPRQIKHIPQQSSGKLLSPFVHAEIAMLEYLNDRACDFVRDYRYIGCSKPSCYCCDLYIRLHPGNFEARQSHGNIWLKWATPLKDKGNAYRDIDAAHETIRRMIPHINREILSRNMATGHPRRRQYDSLTGLSSLH